MNVVNIARQLISIPSYVNGKVNETRISRYVEEYLKQIPYLRVRRQRVRGDRYNIIATSPGKQQLLFIGHLDTVEPKQGCKRDIYTGEIVGDKLYGLGSLDMKGGVAAILSALASCANLRGLTLLFYCDEEYNFSGMRTFIKSLKKNPGFKAVVSAEPTGLGIWNAHRGIIEVRFAVKGVSGHAARPDEGKNAIAGIMKIVDQLAENIQSFSSKELGTPALNVAAIRGGLDLGKKNALGEIFLGEEGNNIADYAEVVLDIRTPSSRLNAGVVRQEVYRYAKQLDLSITYFNIRHDFGPLITPREQLTFVEDSVNRVLKDVVYIDPSQKGYSDAQLLQQKFGIPVVHFGPSGMHAHARDEWVSIVSLQKTEQVYQDMMRVNCAR